jgi:anti-anti-sigma factor
MEPLQYERSSSSPPAHGGALRFLVRFPRDTYAWLGLSGELDMANAEALSSVLDAIYTAGADRVEIDTGEVGFAGCAFLEVIERHARRFEDRGGWLIVSRASRSVDRLFELAGCDRIADLAEPRLVEPIVAEPPAAGSAGD